jgi:hypothetical protein
MILLFPFPADLPNSDRTSDLPPNQMSIAYEEPFTIPSVIVSHRLSGEHVVSPQVEPIIINPMEDGESAFCQGFN